MHADLKVVDLLMAGSCFLLSLLVPTPLGIGRESSTSRITGRWPDFGSSRDAFPGGTLPCILLLYSLQSLLNRGIKDRKTFLCPYSIKKEISWSSLFAPNSFTLLVLTKNVIRLLIYWTLGLRNDRIGRTLFNRPWLRQA